MIKEKLFIKIEEILNTNDQSKIIQDMISDYVDYLIQITIPPKNTHMNGMVIYLKKN